jgi:hypothetical protein
MARNLGREFATMTDDERRRFELKQRPTADEARAEAAADELDLEDPRDSGPMRGRYPTPSDEVADPDAEIDE